MNDAVSQLYSVILSRKEQPSEGSYTCYLFEKGLDKILKKVGEETSEVIIAAKNPDQDQLAEELCDLTYHALVLMAERGISLEKVEEILTKRAEKIGNLKKFTVSDHNT